MQIQIPISLMGVFLGTVIDCDSFGGWKEKGKGTAVILLDAFR